MLSAHPELRAHRRSSLPNQAVEEDDVTPLRAAGGKLLRQFFQLRSHTHSLHATHHADLAKPQLVDRMAELNTEIQHLTGLAARLANIPDRKDTRRTYQRTLAQLEQLQAELDGLTPTPAPKGGYDLPEAEKNPEILTSVQVCPYGWYTPDASGRFPIQTGFRVSLHRIWHTAGF
jgi:hypothetical protein